MELILDAAWFGNAEQVHNYLANALQFPAWYGRNLDALYDCLTDCRTDTRICLKNFSESGGLYRIARVIQQAAKENEYLKVMVE